MRMECTQKLECTQELYGVRTEKTSPEQIGFLGICGMKYPVKKGPNKIGRDPQTCNIVLNLNSISRQHAVINILNQREFMLMDLDSANKTKLLDKTLEPYIPHKLKNGDTVQFGEIFGIFRLLEEDDDLPTTQAIDIPETPINIRHISKINKAPITTIPESPDVSDRDDSFIVLSQPKGGTKQLKNMSNHHFIKPGKTISIQPIGTNKIDNIYWNSSKKSTSLNLDESSESLNVLVKSAKNNCIHEMNTQFPNVHCESTDSIYTANTQMPDRDNTSPSIHTANTQVPEQTHCSPNIHSLETQLPPITEHLPEIRKINKQQDMQFNLYAANKENDNSIFNADTSQFVIDKQQRVHNNIEKSISRSFNETSKVNASDEELLFDDVDNQPLEDDFASQAILPDEMLSKNNVESVSVVQTEVDDENLKMKPSKRVMRIQSDNSTDCEDILPTQKIPEKADDDEDITDCEDNFIEINTNKVNKPEPNVKTNRDINFEDMATQVISYDATASKTDIEVNLADMPTQVIELDDIDKHELKNSEKSKKEPDFEDLPTQVIDDDVIPNNPERINETQPFSEELVSPFKVPLQALFKLKRKDISKLPLTSTTRQAELKSTIIDLDGNDAYYNATQDIYDDLCSQRENSPEIVKKIPKICTKKKSYNMDDKLNPCTVEDYLSGDKHPHMENNLICPKKFVLADKSSSSSDGDEKINRFVRNLSTQQIKDLIGVDSQVTKLTKMPSDASDADVTPKKIRPFKFIDTDLPNSQEIKTSVSLKSKSLVTESSSESEIENNPEDQCTPILFRKKKKPKPEAKVNLTKKLDVESLPTRVITRIRKPTAKISDEESKNILKPIFLTEQEDEVDKEIITENISRLKSKNEKYKTNKDPNKDDQSNEDKSKHDTTKTLRKQSEKTKVKKERNPRRKKTEKESENVNKSTDKSKESHKTRKKETKSNHDVSNETSLKTNEISKINEIKESIDFTIESKQRNRSTRSSRNKDKSSSTKEENKSESLEADSQKRSDNKRKRASNKHVKKEPSPEKEIEVRRSKRQKTVKNKKEDESNKVGLKSILKNSKSLTHEQSTIYNISSGSGNDSPKNLKRSAVDESIVPSPKRTRSVAVSNNSSLRATPARMLRTQQVLFTAFPYEEVRFKLEKLGAVIVTDVTACSVVLTLQIKRTFKLLCAVGLGLPIVGPNWVQACADANMVVDPWLYLIKDKDTEKRFNFTLHHTLTGKRNFLKGYNVSSTPSVMPNASEMKLIVECSGGRWKEEGPQWICVSSTADKALWSSLRRRGATIVSTEFILGGVLRQKLDIKANIFN